MARILCVDDDAGAVDLKCRILADAGHQCIPSTSLQDALSKLREDRFDAVVTDWRIGDEKGHPIVEVAKLYESGPVVVVSGFVDEAFHASEPVADLYLQKPVDPEELVKIVAALLEQRRRTA